MSNRCISSSGMSSSSFYNDYYNESTKLKDSDKDGGILDFLDKKSFYQNISHHDNVDEDNDGLVWTRLDTRIGHHQNPTSKIPRYRHSINTQQQSIATIEDIGDSLGTLRKTLGKTGIGNRTIDSSASLRRKSERRKKDSTFLASTTTRDLRRLVESTQPQYERRQQYPSLQRQRRASTPDYDFAFKRDKLLKSPSSLQHSHRPHRSTVSSLSSSIQSQPFTTRLPHPPRQYSRSSLGDMSQTTQLVQIDCHSNLTHLRIPPHTRTQNAFSPSILAAVEATTVPPSTHTTTSTTPQRPPSPLQQFPPQFPVPHHLNTKAPSPESRPHPQSPFQRYNPVSNTQQSSSSSRHRSSSPCSSCSNTSSLYTEKPKKNSLDENSEARWRQLRKSVGRSLSVERPVDSFNDKEVVLNERPSDRHVEHHSPVDRLQGDSSHSQRLSNGTASSIHRASLDDSSPLLSFGRFQDIPVQHVGIPSNSSNDFDEENNLEEGYSNSKYQHDAFDTPEMKSRHLIVRDASHRHHEERIQDSVSTTDESKHSASVIPYTSVHIQSSDLGSHNVLRESPIVPSPHPHPLAQDFVDRGTLIQSPQICVQYDQHASRIARKSEGDVVTPQQPRCVKNDRELSGCTGRPPMLPPLPAFSFVASPCPVSLDVRIADTPRANIRYLSIVQTTRIDLSQMIPKKTFIDRLPPFILLLVILLMLGWGGLRLLEALLEPEMVDQFIA